MNREIPLTFKNVFAFFFILLLALGFHYLIVKTIQLKDKPVEREVLSKQVKKGLYLFPRFEITVEGSEYPALISKDEFESIRIGDQVSGYMRGEDHFLTNKAIKMELIIGIPLLLFLYLATLFFAFAMLNSTSFVKKRGKLSTFLLSALGSITKLILLFYLLVGLIVLSLVVVNAYHKLNKNYLTEVDALVIDKDLERLGSARGVYMNYELLLYYLDHHGEGHITKKTVTGATYRMYNKGDSIGLFYRNNNVYDTFVQAKSMKEVLPAFFNLFTIMLGLYLVSVYYLLRQWCRKRQRKPKNFQRLNSY